MFPTLYRILEALRVERQSSTPRLASKPERRNGNINLNKYSNPQPVGFTVTLCAPAPRLASKNIKNDIKYNDRNEILLLILQSNN